jgi:hypothetical protein
MKTIAKLLLISTCAINDLKANENHISTYNEEKAKELSEILVGLETDKHKKEEVSSDDDEASDQEEATENEEASD